MTLWTPASLQAGYSRLIAGYDLRVDPSIDRIRHPDAPYNGSWNDQLSNQCLALDPLVWRTSYQQDGVYRGTNGLHLFDSQDEFNLQICQQREPKIIAAFDFPESLLLCSKEQCAVIPNSMHLVRTKFLFCGFDVVSWRGSYSSLYSFRWNVEEVRDVLKENRAELNTSGLISDENAAIRSAIWFSKHIPDHGPFTPCGIWICKSRGNDFIL